MIDYMDFKTTKVNIVREATCKNCGRIIQKRSGSSRWTHLSGVEICPTPVTYADPKE